MLMIIFLLSKWIKLADNNTKIKQYKAEIGGDVLTFEKGDYHISTQF
jgi:hypothetical protein